MCLIYISGILVIKIIFQGIRKPHLDEVGLSKVYNLGLSPIERSQ